MSSIAAQALCVYIPFEKAYNPRLAIVGIDYKINDRIRLSPNVKYVTYSEGGKGNDIYFNISGLITFKSKFTDNK